MYLYPFFRLHIAFCPTFRNIAFSSYNSAFLLLSAHFGIFRFVSRYPDGENTEFYPEAYLEKEDCHEYSKSLCSPKRFS